MGFMGDPSGFANDMFLETPPEYLHCIMCSLVLRDPLMIIQCGHKICRLCFQQVQNDSQKNKTELRCPNDEQVVDLTDVREDIAMQRIIGNLTVRCERHGKGCKWTGGLQELDAHNSQCHVRKELDFTRMKKLSDRLELCYEEIAVLKRELQEQRQLNGDVQFQQFLQHYQLQQHHWQLQKQQQRHRQQQKLLHEQQLQHKQQQLVLNKLSATVEKLKSSQRKQSVLTSIENAELPISKDLSKELSFSKLPNYELPLVKESDEESKLWKGSSPALKFLPRALKRKSEPSENCIKKEEVFCRNVAVQHESSAPESVTVSDGNHMVKFTSLATVNTPDVYSRAIKLLTMVSSSPVQQKECCVAEKKRILVPWSAE